MAGTKTQLPGNLPIREMDCIDCHNRPTHTFQLPDPAMDDAMSAGEISPSLPYIKKQGTEVLRKDYRNRDEAAKEIPAALDAYYQQNYPDIYARQRTLVRRAGDAVLRIYNRNGFPAMKVTWGTYFDNIGHDNFPGCFRCHDGNHAAAAGQVVTQDCGACHDLLAMQDPHPKVLTDLGLTGAAQ